MEWHGCGFFERKAIDVDTALGRLKLGGENLDDGGFSGTGRTDQKDKLAVFNFKDTPLSALSARVVCLYPFVNSIMFSPDFCLRAGIR